MSDEYLWDRSEPADPDVVELERLLSPLGQRQPLPSLRVERLQPLRPSRWSKAILPLAAAAVVLALLPLYLAHRAARAVPWQVSEVEGSATIASHAATGRTALREGEWLRTGSSARATLDIPDVGTVEIGPSTQVLLLAAREGHHRLRLARGTVSAMIWAPPGQFFVETPSSLAVDLGCAYTMHVDEAGRGTLRVTTGWVGFKWHDRLALIPEGALCATRPGFGPGTPYYADADSGVGPALETLDFEATDAHARAAALDRVLALSRPRDALTLWHLLQRLDHDERARVFDRLAALVPPPQGVTREGIQAGDRRMRDLWWDRLGLGDSEFWRAWERSWTEVAR